MNYRKQVALILILLLFLSDLLYSQNDSAYNKNRRLLFLTSSAALYTGSMTALGTTWYTKYEHSSFHWFNDNSEWLQMDKVGHVFTAWKLNTILYEGIRYSGYSKNKSALYSVIASNIAMGSIEAFDGFSAKWGASYGDIIANFAGTSLFTAQNLWLKETWIIPKFSFHSTEFAHYYPQTFGKTLPERTLKDYNGQTYWFAMPLKRIHHNAPEWLCLSIGYGADNMITGKTEGASFYYPSGSGSIQRYRQCYISMDINLRGIKTRSTFLRTCFNIFNVVRIPFPALELSRGRLIMHGLYF